MGGIVVCRSCGKSQAPGFDGIECPSCGHCVSCGSEPAEVVRVMDDEGPLVRCSICGRDNRGYEGASGPILRCIFPTQHRHLVLPLALDADAAGSVVVGRKELIHWPARSSQTKAISRQHMRVSREAKKFSLEDLSANGTSLDGVALQKGRPAPLADGAKIGLVTASGASGPVLTLEFILPRERQRGAGMSRESAPAEVEPVTLPDGGTPVRARPGRPAPPPSAVAAAAGRRRSRQAEEEIPEESEEEREKARKTQEERFARELESIMEKAAKKKASK